MVITIQGQTVELVVHYDKKPTIMAAQMVEIYLDALHGADEAFNHR